MDVMAEDGGRAQKISDYVRGNPGCSTNQARKHVRIGKTHKEFSDSLELAKDYGLVRAEVKRASNNKDAEFLYPLRESAAGDALPPLPPLAESLVPKQQPIPPAAATQPNMDTGDL